MHEVDTAVWRCSAQKKPPLHAHRPATTCEVTCEGAIENPTASERSAKSRSLTRTKFEIAKTVRTNLCRVHIKTRKWEMVENCVESHQTQEDADRRRCCSGDPNKTRECVEFTSKLESGRWWKIVSSHIKLKKTLIEGDAVQEIPTKLGNV